MVILALLWTIGGSVDNESTCNVGDLSWDLQCLMDSWKMASIMRKWYAKYLGGLASCNRRRHNWVLKKRWMGVKQQQQNKNLSLSKPQTHRHIYFSVSTNIYENCPSSLIYLSLIYLWPKPKMVKSDWSWQTLKWKIGWVVVVALCLFSLFFYFKHK